MIEGIKKIREAFRKITAGLRKDGTINAHPGYESNIKEKLKEKEEVSGRILKQMVKKGLIMQRGRGKNTCYVKK